MTLTLGRRRNVKWSSLKNGIYSPSCRSKPVSSMKWDKQQVNINIAFFRFFFSSLIQRVYENQCCFDFTVWMKKLKHFVFSEKQVRNDMRENIWQSVPFFLGDLPSIRHSCLELSSCWRLWSYKPLSLSHTHPLALHSVSSVSGGVATALWAYAAPWSFGVATAASVAISLFYLSAPLSLSFLPSVSLALIWTSHNTCSSCVPSLSVTAFCSLSLFLLFFVLFLLEFLPPLLSLLYALGTLQSSLCRLGKKQRLKLSGKKRGLHDLG